MGLFNWGRKKPVKIAPFVPPTAEDIIIRCNVTGTVTDLPTLRVDNAGSYQAKQDPEGPAWRIVFTIPGSEPPWGYQYEWDGKSLRMPNPLPRGGSWEGPTFDYKPKIEMPVGVVQLAGRAWLQGGQPYYPLASTLLHEAGSAKREGLGRMRQNVQFIKNEGGDVVRILGQVNWPGEEIDENDTNILAQCIDMNYEEGLRTKLTCVGGGVRDPLGFATRVRELVLDNRRHKMLMLEAVNEQNASKEIAEAMARILMGAGVPVATGLGNMGLDTIKASRGAAGSNVDVIHLERTLGSPGEPGGIYARQARQGWDFRYTEAAADNGEPAGVGSSVEQCDDPFILAMGRAVSIICGAGSYCVHTGSGVFGRTYMGPKGMRYANLWEVPNLHAIFKAVKTAGDILPRGIENWEKYNTNLPVEIASGDCNKIYGCKMGSNFVQAIIGASPTTIGLRNTRGVHYDVFNPATGEIVKSSNGTCVVSGLWGYVLIGTFTG